MADEEKAKAEKLAAAKKRVEQLKKQKAKQGAKKEDKKEKKAEPAPESPKPDDKPIEEEAEATPQDETTKDEEPKAQEHTPAEPADPPSSTAQSKTRSLSFRQASISSPGPSAAGLKSPTEGETAPEIYRKQAARIDELERENKRLAKEATDNEKRWKKAEEELDDLRDPETESKPSTSSGAGGNSEEIEKLKSEIAALTRQNAQLQAQHARPARHGSSPSISQPPPSSELSAQLASKSATIESMELELSSLRAALERTASGSSLEKEQIESLTQKLQRSEKTAAQAQQELGDLKKNLERTTEKAVKESSSRTSAETRVKTLEREAEEAQNSLSELQKKLEGLQKKVTTLTTLHKEHDSRSQAQKKALEAAQKESSDLRVKIGSLENENSRLKEAAERARKAAVDGDAAEMEELEDEERMRLEKKVRDLESEVFELKKGVWRERRMEIDEATSPSGRFTDVDLSDKRKSGGAVLQGGAQRGHAGGIGEFFASGINAFTNSVTGAGASGGAYGEKDELLLEDDEMEFDEEAFRAAQEEEARKRIERVKEVKRGLKNWEGWRLDLVEQRRGGGEGAGEIFEV